MKINSLRKVRKLEGVTVLLRTDYNVPLEGGRISDDYRLRAGAETVAYLAAHGARVIVLSHLGDPGGKKRPALSLRPVANRLRRLTGLPVRFVPVVSGQVVTAAASRLQPGHVIMLENVRFDEREYADDISLAKELAALADIYVNDAFAVSHRAQASVSAIKRLLPAYAGLLLEKELQAMERVMKPRRPLVVVLGGAKINTKAPLISRLYKQSRQVLVGGALANNFLRARGLETGQSLVDKDSGTIVRQMLRRKELAAKLVLPVDLVIKRKGRALVVRPEEVGAADMILDIGPETIRIFSGHIKKAKTLLWNGPMGKFEEKSYSHGTLAVGSLIASRASGLAYGVVGGGETVSALEKTGLAQYVDWVSTGGGAMLSYIGGAKMPGLKGIIK